MNHREPETSIKVLWELNKLRGLLRSLEITISKIEIDKSLLRSNLQKVLVSLEGLRSYLKHYADEKQMSSFLEFLTLASQVQQQKLSPQDLFKLFNAPKVPENEIESICSTVNATLMLLDHAKDLPGDYFREKVGSIIIPKLSSLLASIEAGFKEPLHEVVKISKLLGIANRWGMSERWAVATCYLTALEIIVNKKLKELGVQHEQLGSTFKDRFRQLVQALSNKGISIGELEKRLPEAFWELRNKVIHGGYEPNEDELSTIVEWTIKIIEAIMK